MAELWTSYLEGESDLSEGFDHQVSTWAVMRRNVSYQWYRMNRSAFSQLLQAAARPNNDTANETLFNLSLLENEVHPKFVFYLINEAGATPTWTSEDSGRITCIHNFARDCHYQALQVLRDANMLNDLTLDHHGRTPIHHALNYYDLKGTHAQRETLALLCKSKHSHLDALDFEHQKSALLIAYEQGNTSAVIQLLTYRASVLVTLEGFGKHIPSVQSVREILHPNIQTTDGSNNQNTQNNTIYSEVHYQEALQRIADHPRLRILLLPQVISEEVMVDYMLCQSTWSQRLHKLRMGKAAFLAGVILFRVREELREAKRNTAGMATMMERQVQQQRQRQLQLLRAPNIDSTIEQRDRYQEDLEKRKVGQQVRQLHRGKSKRAEREHHERVTWEARQQRHKDRLEKEYNVKLTGLIVG